MHVIYVDDSGQRKPRRRQMGELVSVGGVIVPEPAIAGFASALSDIRTSLRIPVDEEIKWKPPRGSFLADGGGELAVRLRTQMLQAAIDLGIKSAVVVWDRGHLNWERERVERAVLDYLYDRFTWFLRERDDVGIVIADQPSGGRREENAWLADTLGLTNEGTRYTTPERIVSPILTAPSHHVPHLQLADLVTAATTAAVAGYDSGMALAPLLKSLARTNSRGYVGGAGVVLWPRDYLMDLYYWIFGERHYAKDGQLYPLGPSGGPFSQPGHTYEDDDGLLKGAPEGFGP